MIFSHIIFSQTKNVYFSEILTTNEKIAEVSKSIDFNKLVSQIDTFMLINNLTKYTAISKNSFRTTNQLLMF
jgi:hypothetical protein